MTSSPLNELAGLIFRVGNLADRIKEAFTKADGSRWTNAEISRATKRSPAAVSLWLGKNNSIKALKAETASAIEAVTGFSASWLATGRGPKRIGTPPTVFDAMTQEERTLLADLRILSDDDRREMAEEIAKRAGKARRFLAQHGFVIPEQTTKTGPGPATQQAIDALASPRRPSAKRNQNHGISGKGHRGGSKGAA